MVCEGQICFYNIFTTFLVNFCVSHYLKIYVLSVVCHFCCCKVYKSLFILLLKALRSIALGLS